MVSYGLIPGLYSFFGSFPNFLYTFFSFFFGNLPPAARVAIAVD